MASRNVVFPNIGLDTLRARMRAEGVQTLLVKELAANDNSKNQPYLGGDMSVVNILPTGDIRAEVTEKGRESLKAPLPFFWLNPDEGTSVAPNAQLILYPQYPEVRLSGFLLGARMAPNEVMTVRQAGRFLLFGITADRRIIAWAAPHDSKLAAEIRQLGDLERNGVFQQIPLERHETRTTRQILLEELRRIHLLDWIQSKRIQGSIVIACDAPQCVGYTLETELGISPNGRAEPDFLGWEIKASEVSSFQRPPAAKAVTLMTPEPTGGYYRSGGVEAFIRKYGYVDKKGRPDRLNFGGVHRSGNRNSGTGLTMLLAGFDSDSGKITNPTGALALVDDAGAIAAEWSFASLLSIWTRKHAQVAYVPAEAAAAGGRQYRYGRYIRMAQGADFQRLLGAVAGGRVYYDPGIKLENASLAQGLIKRRSQFRIGSKDVDGLYQSVELIDVLAGSD